MKAGLNWLRWPTDAPAAIVIWGALLALTVGAIVVGRWSLGFVSAATLVLSMAPVFLARWFRVALPVPLVMAIILFVFASIFLGEALDFYGRVWWWDLALHGFAAVGFGLIGFLLTLMLFEGDTFAAPPWALALISFCIAMTVGSVWEIFEFVMDRSFGLNMQKSGLTDTMGDLIINAAGGAVAAITGFFYLRGRKRGPLNRFLRQFMLINKRFYRRWHHRQHR